MVVRTLTFLVVRQVLGLIGLGPSPEAKDVEIAVLRHQLLARPGPTTSGITTRPAPPRHQPRRARPAGRHYKRAFELITCVDRD